MSHSFVFSSRKREERKHLNFQGAMYRWYRGARKGLLYRYLMNLYGLA